jgi:hypothetical protein
MFGFISEDISFYIFLCLKKSIAGLTCKLTNRKRHRNNLYKWILKI